MEEKCSRNNYRKKELGEPRGRISSKGASTGFGTMSHSSVGIAEAKEK